MATELWISTTDAPDRLTLESHWLLAGQVNEGRETELWRVVQGHLGLRATSRPRSVEFYADMEPDSDGYQALLEARPSGVDRLNGSRIQVWVALRWAGPPEKTFFATQPAELAPMTRRPPEPHPGLPKSIPVGMKLAAADGELFRGSTAKPS
jgi:hypothetical protein